MEDLLEKQKCLTEQLTKYAEAYYLYDNPLVDDAIYDKLYDELCELERSTGIVLPDSPTQKVQGEVVGKLNKVQHTKPMLSCAKTKDYAEAERFVNKTDKHGVWVSVKLDGASLVLTYENHTLQQAVTRGNGIEGEDVTHTAKTIRNLPLAIPYEGKLELRGECIVKWSDFSKVAHEGPTSFANPRNLAAGSIRQLDARVASYRRLSFVAFDLVNVNDFPAFETKDQALGWLKKQGFETVIGKKCDSWDAVKAFLADNGKNLIAPDYPYDGSVIEYNGVKYAQNLGATAHHENRHLAFKYTDEVVETKFRGVELCTGRSGVVSITGLFDPVEIDGTIVSRASLHNVDIFDSFQLGLGDTITVYKANQIIPQIQDNLTRSGGYELPNHCPVCGLSLYLEKEVNTHVLKCHNKNCGSQLLQSLVLFCSKTGMDIQGLGEAQLATFVGNHWLTNFKDIFNLYTHGKDMEQLEGFGERSVAKLLDAIDHVRRERTLAQFIAALGIPGVGKTTAKLIANECHDNFLDWKTKLEEWYDWSVIPTIGEETTWSIKNWYKEAYEENDNGNFLDYIENNIKNGSWYFIPSTSAISVINSPFNGKTFCITGTFDMGSRPGIITKVEALGGKNVSSVSSKTDILLAGRDCGSKLQKAQNGHTRIIYEEELKEILSNG